MRRLLPVACLLLALALSACRGEGTAPTAAEPVETPHPLPTAEAEDASMQAMGEGDYCLGCHTDKEQLIATARLEEAVEEESTGVG